MIFRSELLSKSKKQLFSFSGRFLDLIAISVRWGLKIDDHHLGGDAGQIRLCGLMIFVEVYCDHGVGSASVSQWDFRRMNIWDCF